MTPDLEKLQNILGFNPINERPDNVVLQAALKELNEEREKSMKDEAKKLLLEAMNVAKEFKKLENKFLGEQGKFNKNFGKLMRRIEAMAAGKEPPKEEEEKEVTN